MIKERAAIAGMTNYTAVPMSVILVHLQNWRDETANSIGVLKNFRNRVELYSNRLERPQAVFSYIDYCVDLFSRYLGDFDRLLTEMPVNVSEAHIEIVRQIYEDASREERNCVAFKHEHIEHGLLDEGMRWLVDGIYGESRDMLIDYKDLSNLVPRLRTFIGTAQKPQSELEQKFGILRSPAQERLDFASWIAEARGIKGFSVGAIFLDIDDFKQLNWRFTEVIVDRAILGPLQTLIRDLSLQRAGAYKHGGEEFLILLPNHSVEESEAFGERLRSEIEAHEFQVESDQRAVRLTISAGVAAWPRHGSTFEQVIEAANRAEKGAKESGKNRVHRAPSA